MVYFSVAMAVYFWMVVYRFVSVLSKFIIFAGVIINDKNRNVYRKTYLQSVVMQIGEKFTYSHVEGGYRAEEVKKALKLLCDAGIIKRVSHTAGNGLPLGAEVNEKYRKYLYLDSGLLLRILDLDLGGARQLTEAVRCSLENFAELEHNDKRDNGALRQVNILPLFAISNLYDETEDTAMYAEKAQQEIGQM